MYHIKKNAQAEAISEQLKCIELRKWLEENQQQ